MRLSKPRIDALSHRLATSLLNKKLIESDHTMEGVSAMIAAVIDKDMAIEDALDREVETLMKKYEAKIRSEEINAHTLFQMIKKQLVRERDLVL